MTRSKDLNKGFAGKHYYIDERGFLVPKGWVVPPLPKKKRIQSLPTSEENQNDNVFKRLRDEFDSKRDPNVITLKLVWDHPRPSKRHYQCPFCSHHARLSRLKKHLKESHGVMSYYPSKKKTSGESRKQERRTDELERFVNNTDELDIVNDDDADYGGKYLGHMRRESGKFGSLPLYEDHDEESKP